jgi:hypothetical protein
MLTFTFHNDGRAPQNNVNNALLHGVRAMPLKDGSADSAASFSADRRVYADTLNAHSNTVEQQLGKKWQGGTRDASEVAKQRRVRSIGASLNPTGGEMSFVSNVERNSRIDALTRCRAGGASTCKKVRFRPTRDGVPMTKGYPISVIPSRSANHAVLGNNAPWHVIHE